MRKLGRKPAMFSAGHMRASMHLNSALAYLSAPPPISYDWSGAAMMATHGNLRMLLNDELGDCLIEGTKVDAADVSRAYRAMYDGPVVNIITASGKRLTVTPKHAVLTPSGFVCAQTLKEGDDLIGTCGSQVLPWSVLLGGKPDFNDVPTRVEEIFSALSLSRLAPSKIVPRPIHFHGDAAFFDGDIDIVDSDGLLRHDSHAAERQPQTENKVSAAGKLKGVLHRSCSTLKGALGFLLPSDGDVGLCSDGPSLRDCHGGVPQPYGLRQSAQLDAGIRNRFAHTMPAGPEVSQELFQSFSGNIARNRVGQVLNESGFAESDSLTVRARFVASTDHPSTNGRATDPELGANLLESFAGLVTMDRVVNVEMVNYKGHVYDLSTKTHWYSAEGVITHNCTAADSGHALMVRTAAVGAMVTPADNDILRLYEATSGYIPGRPDTDVGCVESDVCAYMMSHGLLGHRSAATAPVVTGKLTGSLVDNLKWALELFGPIRLGVNLPASAETQFGAHLPWTVSGDLSILGGHDILLTRYNAQFGYVVTWGQLRPATWQWLELFVEEAHMELFPDLIKGKTTPAGFDLSTLTNELRALAAA